MSHCTNLISVRFQVLFHCFGRANIPYVFHNQRNIESRAGEQNLGTAVDVCVCALLHHDAREQADAAAAVGVWHHVSVSDGQEGDGHHPQGLHVVAAQVPVVVVSGGGEGYAVPFRLVSTCTPGRCRTRASRIMKDPRHPQQGAVPTAAVRQAPPQSRC